MGSSHSTWTAFGLLENVRKTNYCLVKLSYINLFHVAEHPFIGMHHISDYRYLETR